MQPQDLNQSANQTPSQPMPQPQQTDPQPQVKNPLSAMRPGERVICEIKRHPIGLLGIYAGSIFLLLFIAVVGFGLAPSALQDQYTKNQVYGVSLIVLLLFVVLCGLFTFISHIVYWGNRWIVTDDSVTQITQVSLFSKQSSQLSMGNLEDITAEQNGILAHIFNYGVLKVETAGERSKFRFIYCPNPNYYAQCILQAREAFEQEGGYTAERRAPAAQQQ